MRLQTDCIICPMLYAIAMGQIINLNFHRFVLEWFKSYLSDRCFRVKCEKFLFLSYLLLWFPQGSVLGPLLFVLYTTPLSPLISSFSLNYHLYADDTQLFSFLLISSLAYFGVFRQKFAPF